MLLLIAELLFLNAEKTKFSFDLNRSCDRDQNCRVSSAVNRLCVQAEDLESSWLEIIRITIISNTYINKMLFKDKVKSHQSAHQITKNYC